jgi:hypothetical protein
MNTAEKLEREPVFTYQDNILEMAFCKHAFAVQVNRRAAEYKKRKLYKRVEAEKHAYEEIEEIFFNYFKRRKYSNYASFRVACRK